MRSIRSHRFASRLAVATVVAVSATCFVGAGSAYALSAEQIDATTNSFTFKLNIDPTYQNVQMGKVEWYDSDAKSWKEVSSDAVAELTRDRAVLTNAYPGSWASAMRFNYTYVSQYTGSTLSSYATVYDPVTVSDKATGLKIAGQLPNTKKVMFSFKNPGTVFGYEIKLAPKSGKTKTIKKDATYLSTAVKLSTVYESMKLDTIYTAKVRTYVLMSDKTTKKWSAWSKPTVLVPQPHVSGTRYSTYADIKWGKTKGAKNYTIYWSNKERTGYKKIATTSSNKYRITKLSGKKLTSKKHFYLYVKANAKVSGKTYSSPFMFYAYA